MPVPLKSEFSNWPTYPQLYAEGKLVGGLDIVKELKEEGELLDSLPSGALRGAEGAASENGHSHAHAHADAHAHAHAHAGEGGSCGNPGCGHEHGHGGEHEHAERGVHEHAH